MLVVSFKNKYIIFSAALFSPRHYSTFFIKFPFSCVQLIHCLYRWNLNICLYKLPLLRVSTISLAGLKPKRCKLAETTCISQNCNEICLKTPKSGRNARVFAKYMQKLTKALNSNWKTRFCFCFCKIQLMSRSKTRYFQQNRDTIYVKTHNPAKTQCSQ